MSSLAPNLKHQVGRSIRRYRLVELLGSGSFGAVYRADTLSSPVAVKLSEKEHLAKNESEILLTLQGTLNVPQWLYFGQDLSHWVIVMTMGYVNLEELRRRNVHSEFQFSQENLQRIMYQTVTVLQAIHDRGVLHRDIKCNNLMISFPEGTSKTVKIMVIDFGWSCKIEDEEEEAAPRQLGGLLHCSARVQEGGPNCPMDDIVQVTYAAMALTNDSMEFLHLPPPQRLEFKQDLLTDPELFLKQPIRFLLPFFLKVGQLDTFFPLDYDAIRQSIQQSLPESDASSELQLIERSGTLILP